MDDNYLDEPINVFIIYPSEFNAEGKEFLENIKPLMTSRYLKTYNLSFEGSGEIEAGAHINETLKEKLNSAHIVVVLLSIQLWACPTLEKAGIIDHMEAIFTSDTEKPELIPVGHRPYPGEKKPDELLIPFKNRQPLKFEIDDSKSSPLGLWLHVKNDDILHGNATQKLIRDISDKAQKIIIKRKNTRDRGAIPFNYLDIVESLNLDSEIHRLFESIDPQGKYLRFIDCDGEVFQEYVQHRFRHEFKQQFNLDSEAFDFQSIHLDYTDFPRKELTEILDNFGVKKSKGKVLMLSLTGASKDIILDLIDNVLMPFYQEGLSKEVPFVLLVQYDKLSTMLLTDHLTQIPRNFNNLPVLWESVKKPFEDMNLSEQVLDDFKRLFFRFRGQIKGTLRNLRQMETSLNYL